MRSTSIEKFGSEESRVARGKGCFFGAAFFLGALVVFCAGLTLIIYRATVVWKAMAE